MRLRSVRQYATTTTASLLQRSGVRPQLDIQNIVKHADRVLINAQQRKAIGVEPESIVGLAKEHTAAVAARQKLEQQRNAVAKELNAHSKFVNYLNPLC
jgi:hypothetical protein